MPDSNDKQRFWETFNKLHDKVNELGFKTAIMWRAFCCGIGLILLTILTALVALVIKRG